MLVDTMCVNVAELLKKPVGSSRTYHVEESFTGQDIYLVNGEVTLVRTDRGILISGAMSAKVRDICSRCLKSIDYDIEYDFSEESLPRASVPETSLPSDESCNIPIDDSHVIDLSEVVKEYASLSLPPKPLCNDRCAGICLNCGFDLNQGSCGCAFDTTTNQQSNLFNPARRTRT